MTQNHPLRVLQPPEYEFEPEKYLIRSLKGVGEYCQKTQKNFNADKNHPKSPPGVF